MAAMPARFALERGAWDEAAVLEPRPTAYPFTEALTYLARAVGAGHTGRRDVIETSVHALADITERLRRQDDGPDLGGADGDLKRHQAAAWLAWVDHRTDVALDELRRAAALEDGTEKSAVTPGPLVPARETLGELLLDLQRPTEALKEFEAALTREPNRFRSLLPAPRPLPRAPATAPGRARCSRNCSGSATVPTRRPGAS